MTGDKKVFLSINGKTTWVRIGNGALVDVKGKCTISINIKGTGKQIHDVLYVLELEDNVLIDNQSWKMVIHLCLDIIIERCMITLS